MNTIASNYRKIEPIFTGNLRLGESPCWDAARQTIWWVDILGRNCFEAPIAGGVARRLPCPQPVGAVVPATGGGMVVALQDGIYLLDPETGQTAPWSTPSDHVAARFRFNDARVDPRGRLWAGTLALDGSERQSKLYRFGTDRSVATMLEDVTISNGLAWSLDGGTVYYIDSPTLTVQAFPFDLDQGTIGPGRVAIEFAPADGLPDGCAMDVDGFLWVAHWGGGQVTCSDPKTGRRLRSISLPVRNVTACAFAGPQLDQLIITTAAADRESERRPEDGWVFRCAPGAIGARLPDFKLPRSVFTAAFLRRPSVPG